MWTKRGPSAFEITFMSADVDQKGTIGVLTMYAYAAREKMLRDPLLERQGEYVQLAKVAQRISRPG